MSQTWKENAREDQGKTCKNLIEYNIFSKKAYAEKIPAATHFGQTMSTSLQITDTAPKLNSEQSCVLHPWNILSN